MQQATQQADLLVHSASQLVTCASPDGKPKRGAALADVGLIEDGAIAVTGGRIVEVGSSADLRSRYSANSTIDASGKVVCPGFVDCHTHTVYGGDRAAEFEMRIQGAAYLDILAAGGGIISTVRATRAATSEELVQVSRRRIEEMVRLGTTTIEIKTGYGLDTPTELKMLDVIASLRNSTQLDIVPTFLGAHAIPPEYRDRPDDYTQHIIESMLPTVADWYQRSAFAHPQDGTPFFVDIFCEQNAFNLDQTSRILDAAKAFGFGIKAHVDEFNALGGVTAAIERGAISVDHLDVTGPEEIARLAASDTIGVIMPAVNFNFGSTHFANARAMIDAGAAIALATDLNPGSAPCPSMPLVMAMACRYQKLLPAEALNASTINAAHAIGLGDRVGSLEAGKQADLLIVNAPDYRHLAYQFGGNLVERVIKKGIVI